MGTFKCLITIFTLFILQLYLFFTFYFRLDDPHSGIRIASSELLSVLNPFLTADINIENDSAIKFLEVSIQIESKRRVKGNKKLYYTKNYRIDHCHGDSSHGRFSSNTL